ncbi:hypothetical protein U9M48_013442 [Paspalum notatum var. saurae]|uniref:Tf2-1-like SH3-like domain-containing protein n=1 Tax=Paspalum notatum var. saurae TaxID=547442 RepID=A0AAQ3T0E6_PASNO
MSHFRSRFSNTSRGASEIHTRKPEKSTVKVEELFDRRRRPLVFRKDDHVYLRVSPMKGVHRFGVKGKLAPRYVGPFKIIEQCGPVAYRLELPSHLATVHDVFHVSQLKKCLRVLEEVVDTSQIQIEPDLTYSSTKNKDRLEEKLLIFTKYSGVTTPKKKQHGKPNSTYKQNIQVGPPVRAATLSGPANAAWTPAYGHLTLDADRLPRPRP